MDISYTEFYPNRTKYIESKAKLLCSRSYVKCVSLYRFHPTDSFSTALFGGRLHRILSKSVNRFGKQGGTNLLVHLSELCLSGSRFYVTQVFWTAFFFLWRTSVPNFVKIRQTNGIIADIWLRPGGGRTDMFCAQGFFFFYFLNNIRNRRVFAYERKQMEFWTEQAQQWTGGSP
jgi:hypothetical protein